MKKRIFLLAVVAMCLFNACHKIDPACPAPCKLVRIDAAEPAIGKVTYEFGYDASSRLSDFYVIKTGSGGVISTDHDRIFYNAAGKPDSITISFGYFKLFYTGDNVTRTEGHITPLYPFVTVDYTYDAQGKMLTRKVEPYGAVSGRNFVFEYFANGNLKKTTYQFEGSPFRTINEFTYDNKYNPEYYLNAHNLLFILYSEVIDYTAGTLDTDPLSKNNFVYKKNVTLDITITNPAYMPTVVQTYFKYNYDFLGFPDKRTSTTDAAIYRNYTYNCSETPKY